MKQTIIKTDNLSKEFNDIKAVSNLNISVFPEEVYALLGLNGAGKTTTIKMLTGTVKPSFGDASVCGYTLSDNLYKIKEISGVSPQESAISNKLSVYENLYLMVSMYNIKKDEKIRRINLLIDMFNLEKFKHKYASKLSGGYQRRLSISMALISEPKVLYLDEPTLGLDVIARRELWSIIKKLKVKSTIILTTHYLEEVEDLADKIGILKEGKLIFEGRLESLYSLTNKNNIEDAFVCISRGDEFENI